MESAKETGSKIADKGKGTCVKIIQNVYFFYISDNFAEYKESAKDTASKGMESAKETGSKIADKGHGKFVLQMHFGSLEVY